MATALTNPALLDNGLLRLPCEFGKSGHCAAGNHKKCAHRIGGPQHGGVWAPGGWLTNRRGVVVDETCTVNGMHLWKCPCDCHTVPWKEWFK